MLYPIELQGQSHTKPRNREGDSPIFAAQKWDSPHLASGIFAAQKSGQSPRCTSSGRPLPILPCRRRMINRNRQPLPPATKDPLRLPQRRAKAARPRRAAGTAQGAERQSERRERQQFAAKISSRRVSRTLPLDGHLRATARMPKRRRSGGRRQMQQPRLSVRPTA